MSSNAVGRGKTASNDNVICPKKSQAKFLRFQRGETDIGIPDFVLCLSLLIRENLSEESLNDELTA